MISTKTSSFLQISETLVMEFSISQLCMYDNKSTSTEMNILRAKLRAIARMVCYVQKETSHMQLFQLLVPEYYDCFIKAVQDISHSNQQLARAISSSLQQLVYSKIAKSIQMADVESRYEAKAFLSLFKANWTTMVCPYIGRQQKEKKSIKPSTRLAVGGRGFKIPKFFEV